MKGQLAHSQLVADQEASTDATDPRVVQVSIFPCTGGGDELHLLGRPHTLWMLLYLA